MVNFLGSIRGKLSWLHMRRFSLQSAAMVLNSYARMLDAPGAAAAWEVNQADADVLRGLSAVVRHPPPFLLVNFLPRLWSRVKGLSPHPLIYVQVCICKDRL